MVARKMLTDPFSTEHLRVDLKANSVRGGLLTVSSQGAQFLIQTVATVVLARLLAPSDFGLVAMVTAITGIGQAFADLGLSEATIQQPEINHAQVSNLFWINVAIGLGLMSITAALALTLSWFYHDQRLTGITLAMSTIFIIGGLMVQHNALLNRQMRFRSLAIREIVSSIISVSIGITMALRGAGYWALVALPLSLNCMRMLLSWGMACWLPGLPSRNTRIRPLIGFGGNVALSYLVLNVIGSADNVLVGWYWGAGPLGLYSRAFNLLMLPARQLSGPTGRVAVPVLSRAQADPERLERYFLRISNVLMWMCAPVFSFLFVAAVPVVVLVLGNNWREAAPVFQILAIYALGQQIFSSTIWLFVSRGQSKRMLKLALTISVVIVGSYAAGLPFGIKGVALSGSLIQLAILPWVLKFSFSGTKLTLKSLGQSIACPVSLGVASACFAELLLHMTAPRTVVSQLLVAAIGWGTTYLLSLLIPSVRQEVAYLLTLIKKSRTALSSGSSSC